MGSKYESVKALAELPKDYLANVKSVLGPDKGQTVRFGTKGEEKLQPNYQIKDVNGRITPYRGLNHQVNYDVDSYADKNLTFKEFTVSEVNQALNIAVLG